jgi:hypothetical protein
VEFKYGVTDKIEILILSVKIGNLSKHDWEVKRA